MAKESITFKGICEHLEDRIKQLESEVRLLKGEAEVIYLPIMKSNLNNTIPSDSELNKKAQNLINAACQYWQEYQREIGRCAVVWVETSDNHFVLFTRSEYRDSIMKEVEKIEELDGPLLFKPFEQKDKSDN